MIRFRINKWIITAVTICLAIVLIVVGNIHYENYRKQFMLNSSIEQFSTTGVLDYQTRMREQTGISDIVVTFNRINDYETSYDSKHHSYSIYAEVTISSNELTQYIEDDYTLWEKVSIIANFCLNNGSYRYSNEFGSVYVWTSRKNKNTFVEMQDDSGNTYRFYTSDTVAYLYVNNDVIKMVHFAKEDETDNKKNNSSSSNTYKPSSSTHRNNSAYDDGYNDIYENEDYDWERYQWDSDYADGVDDAMEDDGEW